MGRHLISLIDGTCVSASQNDAYGNYSNVYELSHLLQLKDRSEDGRPQIVFYTSGISSQPGTRDIWALMTGKPIVAQILDQYTNLCANYEFEHHNNPAKQDKIYIFGFSRGAMAARALAGLISEYGLLKPRDIRLAPQIIERWETFQPAPENIDLFEVEVEFIGIFDAVMGGIKKLSVFNPIRFPHYRLSKACKTGVHILAIDEDRKLFEHVPWSEHTRNDHGTFWQIWMPGVHSDIGGTGNEFWGRASFLAMAYYIDKETNLSLDADWIKRKQSRLKNALDAGQYEIQQHRMFGPFAIERGPAGHASAKEICHPIIHRMDGKLRYNRKAGFDWRSKRFDGKFGKMTTDTELETYFSSFL